MTKPILSDQEERRDLLLKAARILHENGEETHGTLTAFRRFSEHLGVQAVLLPSWGELFLQVDGEQVRVAAAIPSNVNMNRVVGTLHTIDEVCAGRLANTEAKAALEAAGRAPGSPLFLFVLACTAGAGALVIINGAVHPLIVGIVMLCAAASALLRKGLARLPVNSVVQILRPLCLREASAHWQSPATSSLRCG